MNRNRYALIALLAGAALFSLVWGAVARVQDAAYNPQPEARGGSLWATRAFTTSTMTIGSSAITISNPSFGWSATDLTDAEAAVISAHTQAINFTWDGNDPTATKGQPLAAGSTVRLVGTDNIANLRFIRSGGSDGIVSITLEK